MGFRLSHNRPESMSARPLLSYFHAEPANWPLPLTRSRWLDFDFSASRKTLPKARCNTRE
jgi:hypothetical protein